VFACYPTRKPAALKGFDNVLKFHYLKDFFVVTGVVDDVYHPCKEIFFGE